MKNIAFLAVGCLLLLSACSSSEAWGDALTDTAPPDPNRAHPQSRDTTATTDSTPAEQLQQSAPSVQPTPPMQEDAAVQTTRVVAMLEGYPSCHIGAVRFYVNRRYRGQFDDEGKIEMEVESGELTLEVWDSGGHWLKRVSIQDGQTLQVDFGCDEKTTNVRGVESEGGGSR